MQHYATDGAMLRQNRNRVENFFLAILFTLGILGVTVIFNQTKSRATDALRESIPNLETAYRLGAEQSRISLAETPQR